jgi:hypothetical protein
MLSGNVNLPAALSQDYLIYEKFLDFAAMGKILL